MERDFLHSMVQALTIAQKKGIVKKIDRRLSAREPCTQHLFARWAKDQHRLQEVPNQTTVSRILSFSIHLASFPSHLPRFKKKRKFKALLLEAALYNWMCAKNPNDVQINGTIMRQYATRLQMEANKNLPLSQQLSLSFPNGSMTRFQARHGICFQRVRREAAAADISAGIEKLPNICDKMASFAKRDVWDADEFDLFLRHPPGWSLSATSVQSTEKEKTRLTFLACCNSEGTQKYPLMVIGCARRPRPFGKSTGKELRFDYHANQNAWMTKHLFYLWLERFDSYIGRTSGRKCLMLLDKCSAHGDPQVVPQFRNVELLFLLPSTTSCIQPLQAAIIAAVKAKYLSRLLFRVFDKIDAGAKTIYNVDILTAIRCVREEWVSLQAEVISNCWNHCFKSASLSSSSDMVSEVHNNLKNQLTRDVQEQCVAFSRAGIERLLNPVEEDAVNEVVSLENQVVFITESQEEREQEQVNEDDGDDGLFSVKEQMNGLAIAKVVFNCQGKLTQETEKMILECQRALRLGSQASLRQSSILDHFKNKIDSVPL